MFRQKKALKHISKNGKQLFWNKLKYKLDPFNAYATAIESISTLRFVLYTWNPKERSCEEPGRVKEALFYAQVLNQFLFLLVSYLSYGWYFLQVEKVHLSSAVSDGLLVIGITFGSLYQLNSLVHGRDAEFHIMQQVELNKVFGDWLEIPRNDDWNRGIFYYFCLLCNGTRPCYGICMLPYFLKQNSPMPMNINLRLGGPVGSVGFYIYAAWSAFNLNMMYFILSYYGALMLGHASVTVHWLRLQINRHSTRGTSESDRLLSTKVYKSLQILNILYHPAYGEIVLPTVITCATACSVVATVVVLKLRHDLDPFSLLMVLVGLSQSTGFPYLKFYYSHRMRQVSKEYLASRRRENSNKSRYWSRVLKALRPIGVSVGGFYLISIQDLGVWAEALINFVLLLLAVLKASS